jgi:hypothetical protein
VCTEGCHFYGVGIFNFALLTGKIDALEAAFDTAEFANVSWYGQYSGKTPGQDLNNAAEALIVCLLLSAVHDRRSRPRVPRPRCFQGRFHDWRPRLTR